ncbi:MAG: NACHT domain-containing protein [Planctomycetota bacterium]
MSRRDRLAAALAALLALVTMGRCLGGDWLFDDYRFIVNNEALANLGPLDAFTDPATADPSTVPDIYRPLRTLSFAVEREVLGFGATGFHAVSLLFHALNAALVVLLVRGVGLRLPAAALAGFVFAVHPAQVEAVAWISARADPASTALVLLSLLAWLRSRGPDRWYALAVTGIALAILSKEAAAVAPALLVLVDLARRDGEGWKAVRRNGARYLLPFALSLAAYFLVKGMLEEARQLPMGHLRQRWWGGTFGTNFGVSMKAGAFQVIFAALPVRPSLDWYMPLSRNALSLGVILSGLLHLLVLGAAVRLTVATSSARRAAGAGMLAAYVGGLATSHLLFPVGIPTADRFLYLPLVGGSLALAALADGLLMRLPRGRIVAAVGVVALMTVSAVRVGAWGSEQDLWDHGPAGAYSPRNEKQRLGIENDEIAALIGEAAALQTTGDGENARAILDEAVVRLERCIASARRLNDFWVSQLDEPLAASTEARLLRNLSAAQLRRGDAGSALVAAEQSLELQADHALGHHALAVALDRLDMYPAAGWFMETALRLDESAVPARDAAAVLNKAATWRMDRGLFGAARRALSASARLLPDATANGAVAAVSQVDAQIRQRSDALLSVPDGDRGGAWAVQWVTYVGVIRGDVEAARKEFDRYFGSGQDTAALRTLWALATMEADDTEEGWWAAAEHHRLTMEMFTDAGVRLGLARSWEATGQIDLARKAFLGVSQDPEAPDAARSAARAALERLR